MKIIDYSYLLPSLIIIFGIPLLLYLKLAHHPTKSLDITIYGSTIQTALLAYYIDKNIEQAFGTEKKKYLNITIVSPFDAPDPNRVPKETDKSLLTFCGVENHLLGLLNDLDMQFEINEYGIYFSHLEKGKNSKQADLETYKIQEEYPLRSLLQYGLSHITAKNIFQQFQAHLSENSKPRRLQFFHSTPDLSMASSIYHLFPYKFDQSGVKYLSETIGLDQQYIHDYIMPVVWGNYLHEANSITTLLKLLPLYCTKNKGIGSSLAVWVDEGEIYRKLISKVKYININHVYNHHLQGFELLETYSSTSAQIQSSAKTAQPRASSTSSSQGSRYEIQVTYLNTFINQTREKEDQNDDDKDDQLEYQKLPTNLLFIIQDYDMSNKKQISYYKTIIDGKIKNDQVYQQFFTLYFTYQKPSTGEQQPSKSHKYIYSATRLCKQNCKNFNKNVYLLISKQKLTQKDLGMFEEHHILYYKKFWLPKTQLPSMKKFEQIQNVYRVYDTEAVSDSYQFKLTVLDQLSRAVVGKMIATHN